MLGAFELRVPASHFTAVDMALDPQAKAPTSEQSTGTASISRDECSIDERWDKQAGEASPPPDLQRLFVAVCEWGVAERPNARPCPYGDLSNSLHGEECYLGITLMRPWQMASPGNMHKELQELIRALDEWEAADDRATEAAAELDRHAFLGPLEVEQLRSLRQATAHKLARVRNALGTDFRSSGFAP